MATYNGHKNWNHWNVSLWLNNDERQYREMIHFINYAANKDEAAKMMLVWCKEYLGGVTRDGAPYSKSSIRAAMVGL